MKYYCIFNGISPFHAYRHAFMCIWAISLIPFCTTKVYTWDYFVNFIELLYLLIYFEHDNLTGVFCDECLDSLIWVLPYGKKYTYQRNQKITVCFTFFNGCFSYSIDCTEKNTCISPCWIVVLYDFFHKSIARKTSLIDWNK